MEYYWLISIVLTILVTILIWPLEKSIYKRNIKRLKHTPQIWDEALVWSMHKPFQVFILLWCITYCFQLMFAKFGQGHLVGLNANVRILGTILIFSWFAYRFANFFERRFFENSYYEKINIDQTTSRAIAQIIKVLILVLAVLVILKYFYNISLTGLWAIGGVGSFVIGWAAKDLLANFFGAFMIYTDRPFSIGERIRSPKDGLDGYVEYIGWRLTRIRNFEDSKVYIPNSMFATMPIENVTRRHERQIQENMQIAYKSLAKLPEIIQDMEYLLKNFPHINPDHRCQVSLYKITNSALQLLINCYTDITEWTAYLKIKQEILFKLIDVVLKHHGEIAFDTNILETPKPIEIIQTLRKEEDLDDKTP